VAMRHRASGTVVFGLASVLALAPAPAGADGGSGFDPSLESTHNNRNPALLPSDHHNPNQAAAEWGYANLNEAAFLLVFDRTTRFNPATGHSENGAVTYMDGPVDYSGEKPTASKATMYALDATMDYHEAKYRQERREREAAKASAQQTGVASAAVAATVSSDVGTTVSFRQPASLSVELKADYSAWSKGHSLDLGGYNYQLRDSLWTMTMPPTYADAPAEAQPVEDKGLRPESQTRDEIGKGNMLFEIDVKSLLNFGGGMTKLDPPSRDLLDDGDSWSGYYAKASVGSFGTLDVGLGGLKAGYYFASLPADGSADAGGLALKYSYDLTHDFDGKSDGGRGPRLRYTWAELEAPDPDELMESLRAYNRGHLEY
jgi:hypothetical protein